MRLLGLILGVLLVSSFASPLQAAAIESVRMWSGPDRTTVVFDVSEALEYRFLSFTKPHRLVIDFSATTVPSSLELPASKAAPVKGLRYARRGSDGLRVVLDLTDKLEVESSLLKPHKQYGHRLVLHLRDTNQAAPGRRPLVPATPTKPGSRDIVIAVDAGHGGDDVGAIGPSGVYEKDIVLAISKELIKTINRHDGMRGVLVRDGDYYVGLRDRMIKARGAAADLFVSIHADAFKDRRVRGSSVYVLSQRGASSEAARWLAENANESDLVGGVKLHDKDDVLKSVLLDLSQTASLDSSIEAANAILGGLKQLGKVHKRDVQHAGFMVLKSPDIPSLLVETAFISNPAEEKRLRSKTYQRKLAASIFGGIRRYFEDNTPPGTRMAQLRKHKVSRGDTLSMIAERYDVSMESIKLANNLAGDGVRAGEVLRIP